MQKLVWQGPQPARASCEHCQTSQVQVEIVSIVWRLEEEVCIALAGRPLSEREGTDSYPHR